MNFRTRFVQYLCICGVRENGLVAWAEGRQSDRRRMRVVRTGLLWGGVQLMLLLVGARTAARGYAKFGKLRRGGCVPHRMRVVGLLRGRVRLMLGWLGLAPLPGATPSSASCEGAASFATE